MTRAEMRRAKAAWKKSFKKVANDAAGLWRAELIREDSPHRRETVTATIDWFTALVRCETGASLCLLCDTAFCWPTVLPTAMFYVGPHAEHPKSCSISGICRDCAALPDREIMQRALAVWRRVLPDIRELDRVNVHLAGGRA